ncbi:MAG: hypothetical protein NTV40_01430 [Solirubrobacterales bacterium]|nr:hypothetical protein [Solirubrobacterales bacterium]
MSYVRIYADETGETHFEDVVVERNEETYALGEWLISLPYPVKDMRFRRAVVEYPDEPHVAPARQFLVALAGLTEMEVSDGEVRQFGPGTVVLVEDVTGKGHTTRRVGDTIRETLFIRLAD